VDRLLEKKKRRKKEKKKDMCSWVSKSTKSTVVEY
jgi:hypothetical protein